MSEVSNRHEKGKPHFKVIRYHHNEQINRQTRRVTNSLSSRRHHVKNALLLTLLPRDGDGEEGDEGGDRQQREGHSHDEEEAQALQPGLPVALDVHDVGHQGPEGQHT